MSSTDNQPSDRIDRVRELNDEARRNMSCRVFFTKGMMALGQPHVGAAIEAVRNFTDFTPFNDPWGEHDYGSFEIAGVPLMWKIDVFERGSNYEMGASRSDDPNFSERVITIMLADEY